MSRFKPLLCHLLLVFLVFAARTAIAYTADSSADAALTALQTFQQEGRDAFVLQGELDSIIRQGGGGACASAVAIDAIQALRLMAGMEPLANPHKAVLAAIGKQDELLNGRVSNQQFVTLINGFASEHLKDFKIDIEVFSSPHGSFSPVGHPWDKSEGPNLSIKESQLKIVTFTWTEASGRLLGRHFVLLKRIDDNEISVIDPSRPLKKITYTLASREEAEWGRRFFLLPPAKVKTSDTFEIDTVFTLRIKDDGQAQSPGELAQLTKRIDETADALRAVGELRSPRKWREASAAFGLPGLDLPVDCGGSDWSSRKTLEAFICAGRHDLNCRDVVGGGHVRPLRNSSHPKMKEIIQQVVRGDAYVAITITEPHTGSDVHSIKSTARKVDGGYLLSGEKRYVARLEQATHVIIFTQPASGEPRGLSAFVLPIDTPGLQRYSFGAHGLTGNSFGGMRFNDVRVEEWQMIGADGKGYEIFNDHFRYWRLMQVAAAIGTAQRALELTVDRLLEREAYGAPIGRFSHLQQAVGQHTTELKMAKSLAVEAATMIDEGKGEDADAIINGLKSEGVEIALATVDSSVRAFGAEGYSDRVDLGDRLRDLNGLRIADGTTDVMRMSVVARSYGEKGKKLWDMAVRGHK